MRTGEAIIGANYGDEGKGLMTDYFASLDPEHSVVVRFNGGAQAGHTVVLPDGRRHVFSHFGAGSFAGCPTYLSKFFIVNPLLFCKELNELETIGVRPLVGIHSDALVTTPFDMFINQLVERRRAAGRHGSCGLGINETVTRSWRSTAFALKAGDLSKPDALFDRLIALSESWLPARLREFHIDPACDDVRSFLDKVESILHSYIRDVETLLSIATITANYPMCNRIIFEGAQGLMLDEDRIDQWPHVTRSKTGLTNVLYLASRFQLSQLNVTYVSRTYLTRHGAGPLQGECDWSFADQTNITNQFQGRLRFAPLALPCLQNSINLDFSRARMSMPSITAQIALTCADQVASARLLELEPPVGYVSYGPRRCDVVELKDRSFDALSRVGHALRA